MLPAVMAYSPTVYTKIQQNSIVYAAEDVQMSTSLIPQHQGTPSELKHGSDLVTETWSGCCFMYVLNKLS